MEWDDPFSKKIRYDDDPTSVNPNDWEKTKKSKKKKKSPEIFLIESPDQKKQQEQYMKAYSDAIISGNQAKTSKIKPPDLSAKKLFGIEFKDSTDTAKGVRAIYAPNMRNTSDQQKNDSAGLRTMAGVFHGNYANPLYDKQPEEPDLTYGGLSATSVDWQGNVKLNPTAGAQASSRLKHKSRAKVANFLASASTDATLIRANEIQAELGRDQITTKVTRRRRGRWNVSLTGDPKAVIQKYEEDKALIEWGKKVGGLSLDPKRMVSVVDVASSKQVPRYWTHNGSRRLVGYRTVNTSTYKDVLATSRPKGEKMNMLVAKLNKQAGQKKERFGKLYDHDPEIPDHVYYSVTEEQFQESEDYKSDLIKGINTQKTSTIGMRNAMAQSPFVDAPSNVDDNSPKMSYLNYQKTGQDDTITPIVTGFQSEISTIDKDVATQQLIIDAEKQNISKNIQLLDPTLMVNTLTPIAESKSKASARWISCRPYHICAGQNTSSRNKAKKKRAEGKALFETVEKIKGANIEAKIENLDEFAKHEWANTQTSSIKASQQKIANVENKIATISEDAGGYRANENQNITNAITFVEGKSKDLLISGKSVATRDNMGYITVTDKETYGKYVAKTPEKYLRKSDNNLEKLKIAQLEDKYTSESEKHSATYDEIKALEEAEKKKAIALHESKIRENRERNQVLQSSGTKRAKVRNTTPTRVRRR